MISYGSVCSGIEAASVAWHSLGFHADWFSEIEAFPSAVLAHRWPDVPNLGDMTKLARQVLTGAIKAPPLLVGGTPCQAFSVAGMREGLADPRGALTIKYVELLDAIDHVRTQRGEPEAACLWENVPGVLSDKGNAFGCFLGALVGESEELQPPGGKWKDAGCVYGPRRTVAWRVLDAQYFGLAQRRRRVFVVASARAGFDPAAVLFESDGVRRDSPPSRGQGEEASNHPAGSPGADGQHPGREEDWRAPAEAFGGGKNCNPTDVSTAVTAHPGGRYDLDVETFVVAPALRAQGNSSHRADSEAFVVAGTLQASGKAAGSATQQDAESGLLVVHGTQDPDISRECAHTLGRNNGQENAVLAFSCKDYGADAGSLAPTLRAMGHDGSHANAGGQVAVCITGEITHTLKAEGFDASEDGTGRGQPIVADVSPTLRSANFRSHSNPLTQADSLVVASAVRRLTPRECELLQGFPDDYTLIPWRGKPAEECPDGPRYKAIGNSKAIPVVRWIGWRLILQLKA